MVVMGFFLRVKLGKIMGLKGFLTMRCLVQPYGNLKGCLTMRRIMQP